MMQQKKPISRSSTPIEFTPLILDLEPEETKEEPKKKRGNTKLFATLAGIALVLAFIIYWGFRNDAVVNKIKKEEQINNTSTFSGSESGVASVEKQRIFIQGAKNAKLQLEHRDGQDIIKVLIQDTLPDGITWAYEWSHNNEPFGKGESVRGTFKRGDTVAVKILPFDGENYGTPKLLTTEIKNTVPRVIEGQSTAAFNGKNLTYQLKATDPDGDALTYTLVEGPPGVTVDQKNGIITWPNVPEDQQKLDIKVKISDGHNGEIIYQSTVNFSNPVTDKLTSQKSF